MAIRPSVVYPGQVATDANWPHGKARNVLVLGDGTGTPLEQGWLNDLWGFLQALLTVASITPSDTADNISVSQYLQAIQYLILHAATFSDAVTFEDDVTVDGDLDVAGAAMFSGATTFNGSGVAIGSDLA